MVVLRVPLEIPSDEKNVIALFLMYETWYEYYSLLILLLFSSRFRAEKVFDEDVFDESKSEDILAGKFLVFSQNILYAGLDDVDDDLKCSRDVNSSSN